MNQRFFYAAALAVLLVAGCQRNREAYMVEVFNAQNLILEDKIYELNDRIDALESRTAISTERAPRRLDADETTDESSAEPSDSMSPEDEIPDLTPPDVEPGVPTEPEDLPDPSSDVGADDSSIHKNASHSIEPQDREVVSIAVAHQTRFTEDGAVIVLQAQNREGQPVAVPAKISIGVRNPATDERFGEWYFDANSVSKLMRAVDGRPAIVLDVQWSQTPNSQDLELGVIYEKANGQKIKARAPLQTRTQTHVADRWTPRPARPSRTQDARSTPHPMPAIDDGPGAEVYQ